MRDAELRAVKDRIAAPIAARVPAGVSPNTISAAATVCGVAAAVTAGCPALPVALWLVSRALDGLDGSVARIRGRASDLGGYLDILGDFVVYSAVPLGVAAAAGTASAWTAAAVLLATFYVNAISWSYLSVLVARAPVPAGRLTAVAMPGGLIEGAETIVAYTVMLAVPAAAVAVMWILAVGVVATAGQRLGWACRNL